MKKLITITAALAITWLTSSNAIAQIDALYSLKNLERERASLLAIMTDVSLSVEQRHKKQLTTYRRMTDIERMVLRDDRIAKSDKFLVQKAFANYDLTFLVHASAEHNVQPLTQWLNTLGINANSITQSTAGHR